MNNKFKKGDKVIYFSKFLQKVSGEIGYIAKQEGTLFGKLDGIWVVDFPSCRGYITLDSTLIPYSKEAMLEINLCGLVKEE